jgi:hypothetical protein
VSAEHAPVLSRTNGPVRGGRPLSPRHRTYPARTGGTLGKGKRPGAPDTAVACPHRRPARPADEDRLHEHSSEAPGRSGQGPATTPFWPKDPSLRGTLAPPGDWTVFPPLVPASWAVSLVTMPWTTDDGAPEAMLSPDTQARGRGRPAARPRSLCRLRLAPAIGAPAVVSEPESAGHSRDLPVTRCRVVSSRPWMSTFCPWRSAASVTSARRERAFGPFLSGRRHKANSCRTSSSSTRMRSR